MTTFTCTYEELKKMAADYLKEMPSLDEDGLENGLKCFHLHYLGCTFQGAAEEIMAVSLVKYVGNKYFDALFALATK